MQLAWISVDDTLVQSKEFNVSDIDFIETIKAKAA